MTKRKALAAVKRAEKTAAFIMGKNCGCDFCKAARRLIRQLKPAREYLEEKPAK